MSKTSAELSPREALLLVAKNYVCGDRNASYGEPTQDFDRTADLWNAMGFRVNGEKVQGHHIALAMISLKISRAMHAPGKYDTLIDIAGYAACGWECVLHEGYEQS